MPSLTKREHAQRLALQGDIPSAVAELSSLQAEGDRAASASLAEIAAYEGRWKEASEHAGVVLCSPSAVKTVNVFVDMIALVARTGVELGDWPEVRRLAKLALTKLGRSERYAGHVQTLRALDRFATGTGSRRFVDPSEDAAPEEVRKARFDAGLFQLPTVEKRFRAPPDRIEHLFGLARACEYYAGAVAIYDQEKALPRLFDATMFAASALARCGRAEEAWSAVRSQLHLWSPVEDTQIAPVGLLTDEALGPLMTPERCQEVLRTPRGSGGR